VWAFVTAGASCEVLLGLVQADLSVRGVGGFKSQAGVPPALLLLYCCFTAALLLLYECARRRRLQVAGASPCCFTAALLLLYCCFTAAFLLLY
jgi:hypothetical protein